MDFKRLTHLLALAEERNFARAAERVHLSQPAFSRSIQWLEQHYGLRLFDRETGIVKPTPAGEFVIDRARRLMFDARGMQHDVALYRDHQLGDLAFGVGPIPMASLMPSVTVALRRRHPGVSLRLETASWPILCEQLLAEDIEFYLGEIRDLPDDHRVEHTPLVRQLGGFFVRAGHPLAGKPCTFKRAFDAGLAAPRMPQQIRSMLARLLGLPRGEELLPAFECNDMTMLRLLALSTDAVVASTHAALRAEMTAGTLVALDVVDLPDTYVEIAVMTLAGRTLSPMAQAALTCIRDAAAAIDADAEAARPVRTHRSQPHRRPARGRTRSARRRAVGQ